MDRKVSEAQASVALGRESSRFLAYEHLVMKTHVVFDTVVGGVGTAEVYDYG